jgi:Na+/melibiose symporter-like transporter
MRGLLVNRNLRLLVLAQIFSLFGDAALWLAMGLWARALTGSDAAAGMVFFALAAPALVAPFGGLVVDRMRRRPLMIATDIVSAAAVLLLVLVHDRGQLWIIYLVAVANGIGLFVFGAAQSALLARIVSGDTLGQVNGILQSLRQALKVLSPLVGAGLFAALGGGAVAIVDASTFLISATCVLAMRVDDERPVEHQGSLLRELTAGARHLIETAPLRRIVTTMAAGFLVIGFAETLVFAVVTKVLGQSLAFVGVMSAAQGIGAIAGGLTGSWILARVGDGRLVAIGLILFGVGEGMLVLPSSAVALAAMAVAGAGLAFLGVGFYTGLQLRTPDHLQGRTYSASEVALTAPQTLSIGAGALLSLVIDFRILLGLMTLGLVASGTYLFSRSRGDAWPPSSATPAQPKEVPGLQDALVAPVEEAVRGLHAGRFGDHPSMRSSEASTFPPPWTSHDDAL